MNVVNDADAAGEAEARFGHEQARSGVVVLLTLGTGIGSALVVDGELIPNTEFGHLKMGKSSATPRTWRPSRCARARTSGGRAGPTG